MSEPYSGYDYANTTYHGMEFRFKVGDFVEIKRCPGAVFEVIERYRAYDSYPLIKIKFVGPHKGLHPVTKGRLHKLFRIKTLTADQDALIQANAMLVLALMARG